MTASYRSCLSGHAPATTTDCRTVVFPCAILFYSGPMMALADAPWVYDSYFSDFGRRYRMKTGWICAAVLNALCCLSCCLYCWIMSHRIGPELHQRERRRGVRKVAQQYYCIRKGMLMLMLVFFKKIKNKNTAVFGLFR